MRNGLSIEKQKLEQILSVRYYRRHNDLSDEKCWNYYTKLNNIPIKECQNNYISFPMKERIKFVKSN